MPQSSSLSLPQEHPPLLLDLGNFRAVDEAGSKRSQPLSWRLAENLSDWTIEINGTDVYHVHKSFLAAGKRSSLYFERLFQSGLSETVDGVSRIDLESSAAHAVPAMLDFMYYTDTEVKATTYTAVALRHLANYFSMEEMFDSVNRFIQTDFTTLTAVSYLQEASLYKDAKMMHAAGHYCALHFSDLDETELVQRLDPCALHLIVTHSGFSGDSFKLSRLVAHVCLRHPDMDSIMLEQLTSFVNMPTVDPDVALSLLQTAMTRKVATLKNRTVKAASEQWIELAHQLECCDTKKPSATTTTTSTNASEDYYSSLPEAIKVKVLEKSLCQARNDYSLLEEEKKDLKRELRDKTRDLKRRQRLIAEATREEVLREQEEVITKIQHEVQLVVAEKDAVISSLQAQLKSISDKKSLGSRSRSKQGMVVGDDGRRRSQSNGKSRLESS